MVVVSYLTEKPDPAQIRSLAFGTATEEDRAQTRDSWGAFEVFASLVVVVCIIGAYIYFTG